MGGGAVEVCVLAVPPHTLKQPVQTCQQMLRLDEGEGEGGKGARGRGEGGGVG